MPDGHADPGAGVVLVLVRGWSCRLGRGLLSGFAEDEAGQVAVALEPLDDSERLVAAGLGFGGLAGSGRPWLACVDRGLPLPPDGPLGSFRVGLELPPPLRQALGLAVSGFGLDSSPAKFLTGCAGGESLGFVRLVPAIPGILGGAQLGRVLGLLGGGGAGAGGELEPSACPRRPATVFRSVPAARSWVAE